MEIDTGRYVIKSDQQNLWIEKRYVDRNGKIQVRRVAGYSRNLEDLYTSFADAGVRSSEARSVKELLEELKGIRSEILNLVRKGEES